MYLLAGLKQGGWLTKTGQYSTDITAAAKFEREDALERARRHKSASNILLLVNEDDVV